MKIEKINDNSIRCTLTSFDLSVRNLNIKELAYGTEKAKKLFEEMMTRASDEVGFTVENSPLMIEAIPMNSDSVQLIISKVDDPEELDARFSKFTKSPQTGNVDHSWLSKLTTELLEGAGSIFGQIQKLNTAARENLEQPRLEEGTPANKDTGIASSAKIVPVISVGDKSKTDKADKEKAIPNQPEYRVFVFGALTDVIGACKAVVSYTGNSKLYKKPDGQHYVLVIENIDIPQDQFAKTCNLLAEFGRMPKTAAATISYFEEHYTTITKDSAIQKLAGI